MNRSLDRRRRERGAVEVLAPAVLVGLAGTLLLVQAWAVLDARLAVQGAAHAAGRAYVAEARPASAATRAHEAASLAYAGAGQDPRALRLEIVAPPGAVQRCAVVRFIAVASVPSLRLPFLGRFGPPVTVRGRDAQLVEPFRARRPGSVRCSDG